MLDDLSGPRPPHIYHSYWQRNIRFVHFSVQEYILNDSIDDSSTLSVLNIKPEVAHAEIAQLCMVFIMFCYVHDAPYNRAYSGLCNYAYDYWNQHARTLTYISNELMTTIHNFFKSSLFFTFRWMIMENEFNCAYLFEHDTHTQFSPVVLALIFDLPLVSKYLEKNHDLVDYPADRYAIHYAVNRGSCEAVRRLLDDKICHINELGINGEVPVYYAPNKEVCQFLLDKGADVNIQGGDLGDALRAAIVVNRKEVVRLLLHSGANVNAQGGYDKSALGVAIDLRSSRGNLEIVELLLDRGADVNDPNLLFDAVVFE